MSAPRKDKWTAFWLSLLVPGAGQWWAGSGSCAVWFMAAAGLGLVPALLDAVEMQVWKNILFIPAGLLGLLSAEHAKRCLEVRPARNVRSVMTRLSCRALKDSTVHCQIELDVPRPRAETWSWVADLPRFLCIDPFHRRVIVLGKALKPGVPLALEHAAFGVTFWRFGRLLSWKEGIGYAFSDLSKRGAQHGFPHVFFVRVTPGAFGEADRSRLVISVRGKWTARWMPRWLRHCWLRYVCFEHARLLKAACMENLQ